MIELGKVVIISITNDLFKQNLFLFQEGVRLSVAVENSESLDDVVAIWGIVVVVVALNCLHNNEEILRISFLDNHDVFLFDVVRMDMLFDVWVVLKHVVFVILVRTEGDYLAD